MIMKKLILLFVVFTGSLAAMADDSGMCGDNVTWTYVSASGILTIQGQGAMENYTSNYSSSTAPWNIYQADIKTIIIKDGVTSIGQNAFFNCSSLTSVSFPISVITLGSSLFKGCSNLKKVVLPNSIANIPNSMGCGAVEQFYVPGSVNWIGRYGINECDTVIIEDGNTHLSLQDCNAKDGYWDGVFSGVKKLYVGRNMDCSGYSYAGHVFTSLNSSNTQLTDVIFGPQVTSALTGYEFRNCDKVTSVTCLAKQPFSSPDFFQIPQTAVLYVPLGSKQFYESATGWSAFKNIEEVTEVRITMTGTEIVYSSDFDLDFSNVEGLKAYVVDNYDDKSSTITLKHVQIVPAGKGVILKGVKGTYTVPCTNVETTLADPLCGTISGKFIRSAQDDNVNFVFDEVEHIFKPIDSVYGCQLSRNKAYLTLPASSMSVYESITPQYNEDVKNINFSDVSVKTICVANWDTDGDGELSEEEAAAVTSLGEVFKENTAITSFNELQYFTGLTSIDDNAFRECTNLSSVIIPNGVETIRICAFYGCGNLVSVNIPEGVKTIDGYAFMGCSKLASVNIPASVTTIVYDAFNGCSSLTSIIIPDNVTRIDNGTFSGCSSLTTIVIPDGVESIGASAFMNCSSLGSVNIPEAVKIIGSGTFYGCSSLTSVDIPYDVRIIGPRAFEGCTVLTSIKIPSQVNTIGDRAFYGCDGLTSVTIEVNTPMAITEDVFSNRVNATLTVPTGCKSAYGTADYWKEFKEIIEVKPDEIADTDISLLDNVIYMNKVEVRSGSQLTLPIQMKNSAAIRGFQFNVYLPEGVTPVVNSKGRIQAMLSDGRREAGDEHSLTASMQEDGSILFLCGSLYDETFTGTDGEILTLTVDVADNMEAGDYAVYLKNIKLTETDISKSYETALVKTTLSVATYTLGDINDDNKIDVSDYIGIANRIIGKTPEGFNEKAGDVNEDKVIDVSDYIGVANLIHSGSIYGKIRRRTLEADKTDATDISELDNIVYVAPGSIKAGEKGQLSICMKNSALIRGYQFSLYLPEGVNAEVNSKGRIVASMNKERLETDDEHTLTTSLQEDDSILFLCGSLYDESYQAGDGEIVTLNISVDEGAIAGDYPIVLKNIKLTETDISKFYETETIESVFTVASSATGIASVYESWPDMENCYNLNGQRIEHPKKGIYITIGKKVVIR